MSDTLKGYTLAVHTTTAGEDTVALECEQCGGLVIYASLLSLPALVRLATQHSGRCLG